MSYRKEAGWTQLVQRCAGKARGSRHLCPLAGAGSGRTLLAGSPLSSRSLTSRGAQEAGRSPWVWSWLYVFPLTTLGLGIWQTYRLQWKLDLIASSARGVADPPRPYGSQDGPPSGDSPAPLAPAPHQRILVSGEFIEGHEFLIGPRTRNTAAGDVSALGAKAKADVGYLVIAPFKTLPEGDIVFVNRGWIPRAHKDAKAQRQPRGRQTLTTLKRDGESPSAVVPDNEPAHNTWYSIKLSDLTALVPGSKPLLFEVVQDSDPAGATGGGAPQSPFDPLPRPPHMHFRNDHLAYAITWYGLTACSLWLIQRGGLQKNRFRVGFKG